MGSLKCAFSKLYHYQLKQCNNIMSSPMYSVGYAGFYGVSIMANSYTVLFVSLLAHGAQFVFLYLVEEPHIKKIYGSGSSSSLRSDHRIYDILYGRDSQNAY
eukprot:Partr_v1_DN28136_c2_g1_i1_m56196 putative Catalyzes the first step in the conversion of phosphatidylethanolamine to phosphatidylcholine during the methylation pathway of phosphatidylcholine biosynthesis (By similarity)